MYPAGTGAARVTVKLRSVVPISPSAITGESMVIGKSSLRIVPVPLAPAPIVPVRVTLKVSSASKVRSPLIVTGRSTLVAPAAKGTVAFVTAR